MSTAEGPRLISASRRTDIPRYYAPWFAARRSAGFASYRNVFGVTGSVSLRPRDVLGYLFWTRDAGPFTEQLRELCEQATPFAFQFTINGYGPELELRRPEVEQAIASFRTVSQQLPGPEAIQWRYDPIILSDSYTADFHLDLFTRIARQLTGATSVVNVSFVEPYLRALRRIADRSTRYRPPDSKRHKSVLKRHPDLPTVGPTQASELLAALALAARAEGIELRTCCNPHGQHAVSQCVSPELFLPYGESISSAIEALDPAPSRSSCRCLRSVDIGMADSCVAGCAYCYAVRSPDAAVQTYREHDFDGVMIRTPKEM